MLFRGLCQAICYLFEKLRQQRNFRHAITGFPAKWCLRRDGRNSILMTSCWWRVTTHANLVSVSNCSCLLGYLLQPIRSTTQTWVVLLIDRVAREIYFNQSDRSTSLIWVVTRHQYGIYSLVSQTSFVGCLFTPRQLFCHWRLCLGIFCSHVFPPLWFTRAHYLV